MKSMGSGDALLFPSGAEVDKVELEISAQYTRIYPHSMP